MALGGNMSEGEISDKEVTDLLSSTTLVKTSPVTGLIPLFSIFICFDSNVWKK